MNKTKWKIDKAHSQIGFEIKHMKLSSITGHFDEFEAYAGASDDTFMDAKFNLIAKIQSINTKNKDRDKHLKSDDFFNSEKFPESTFKSKSFDGKTMVGDLTIRDVTKEVVLDVDFNGVVIDVYGQTKTGFEAAGTINRKDFNINWNAVTEAGIIMLSDKVKLTVNLQFIKQ